jgi:hypothetical protein
VWSSGAFSPGGVTWEAYGQDLEASRTGASASNPAARQWEPCTLRGLRTPQAGGVNLSLSKPIMDA